MFEWRRAVFVLGSAPLIVGCGGGGEGVPPVVGLARDSAGVTIVESRESAWPDGVAWRLSPAPELEIGVVDGPPEYQFQSVAGIVGLTGGRLVVADGGASEIRVYDPTGQLIRAAGRPGGGPGEYRLINAIGLAPGDTLWVYDFGQRRFTLLRPDLLVARTVTLGGDLSAVAAVGMPPGGGFLVRESWAPGDPQDATLGLRRGPAAVAWLNVAGALRDTVALVRGREVVISSEGGRGVMTAPVVARRASVALAGDAVIVGDQETWELRVYGLDGALRRIIRRASVDLTLDRADVARIVDRRLDALPSAQRPAARLALESLPLPPTRPAYGSVLLDPAGRLWVAAWAPDGEAPPAWAVFDPDGRLLGDVIMPTGYTPQWVGEDVVAGVWRDDDGVERVRLHRIERD